MADLRRDLPRFRALRRPVAAPAAAPVLARPSAAGAEIWIKREDLLPLAFGGNKLRNLEFLIGAALAEGADTLVTSGRRWSNHCRLTAAAGARPGSPSTSSCPGRRLDPPGPGVRLDAARSARRSTSSRPPTGPSARPTVARVVDGRRAARAGGRT